MKSVRVGRAYLVLMLVCSFAASGWNHAAEPDGAPFPGKPSDWNGFTRYDFEVDGKPVLVVVPKETAEGKPWVWHGEFFGHKPAPDVELLKRGFHIAYMRVPDMLGSPTAVGHWNNFYDELTGKYGLSKKAALVGLSRGGLYCYNWAAANPAKVACVYGDAPVCDFKSWPGGRGKGKGSPRDWRLVIEQYGFKDEAEALAYDQNPVDNLAPLAVAKVPLLHVYGDADDVVPWDENTGLIAERYKKLGGSITLIAKPGVGHHPHGLDDPTPIVEFIARHATADKSSALPRATPESQGIASSAVRAFVEAADQQVESMHSFMLVRHGHVVAEGWWSPEAADKPHILWSLSKSFTSTAVGLAVAEGKLDIDDKVLDFFPEDAPAEPSDNLKAMRVRDLLTMSTGHAAEPWATGDEVWTKRFLAEPAPHKPGSTFLYNTPATYMQSAIVQKVAGQTIVEYLTPRLFEPLGIETPTWDKSPQGVSLGGYGLYLKTEDIAKFGQLYLQKGEWNGKRLIPAEWIAAATSKQVDNDKAPSSGNPDWREGYGFQFWQCRHGAYRGDGKDGQFCIVLPKQDAVIAITAKTGNMQKQLDLVWEHLLPAFHDEPLAENTDEAGKLRTTLLNLKLADTFLQRPAYVGLPKQPDHAPTNRAFQGIPSMAVAPGGRLWANWYAGVTPSEDHNNYVVVSTSGDDGRSWRETLVVDPDGSGPLRAFDPELWVAPTGRLFVFWAQSQGHDGAVAGVWSIHTDNPDDDQPQWSQPQRLTDGIMMCKPMVLSTGEWVLPASTWRTTDNSARMIVSANLGRSWSLRGACNVPKDARAFDEHILIERNDRSLWLLARTKYGIGESVSTDRGKTWPDLKPSPIAHPSARFFVRRLKSGNLLLVKHGPIDQRTGRSHLTAFVSADDGKNWTGGLMLDERSGVSYPDGQQTDDGLIRIIYDFSRTGSRHILMATFREDDVAAGKPVSDSVRLRQLVSEASGAAK